MKLEYAERDTDKVEKTTKEVKNPLPMTGGAIRHSAAHMIKL